MLLCKPMCLLPFMCIACFSQTSIHKHTEVGAFEANETISTFKLYLRCMTTDFFQGTQKLKSNNTRPCMLCPSRWCVFSEPRSNTEHEGFLKKSGYNHHSAKKITLSHLLHCASISDIAAKSSQIKYGVKKKFCTKPKVKLKLHPVGEPHIKLDPLIKSYKKE